MIYSEIVLILQIPFTQFAHTSTCGECQESIVREMHAVVITEKLPEVSFSTIAMIVLTVLPHIGISVIVECHVAQIKGKGVVCLQGK